MKNRLFVALLMLIVTTVSYGVDTFIEVIAVPKGATLTIDTQTYATYWSQANVIKGTSYNQKYRAELPVGIYFTENFLIPSNPNPAAGWEAYAFTTSQGRFFLRGVVGNERQIEVVKETTNEAKSYAAGQYGIIVECDGSLTLLPYKGW